MQMGKHWHPLAFSQLSPEQLACCCCCSFSAQVVAGKSSQAWFKVRPLEERPAAGQPHSGLMVGSRQLRGTLQPVFQDHANQRHGLWACKKCAAAAAGAPAPPQPQATAPLPPLAQSKSTPPTPPTPQPPKQAASTSTALPHHIAARPPPQQQQQQHHQPRATFASSLIVSCHWEGEGGL